MTFHSVGNVIIPTDEVIFFKMVKTTNQINYVFFVPLKVGFDLRNILDSTSLRMWLSTNIGISLGCCSQRRMFCDENQVYPLVMTNIAMENGPFTDGLPIKNGDFPIKHGDLPWEI